MAPSTIRKAIGAMKDQTSIGIAKVAGNVASDLEILIVKATGHDAEPANEKYVSDILRITKFSRGNVDACLTAISKRLSKTRDWTVVLKCLMLVHRLLIEGNFVFLEEVLQSSRRGTRVLNTCSFRDDANSDSWDHSIFVRNYALYLNQTVEFMIYERRSTDDSDRLSSSPSIRSANGSEDGKSQSSPLGDLRAWRIIDRTSRLQRLLDMLMACRPNSTARFNRMILIALYPIIKESFKLYFSIRETTTILLDRYTEMECRDCAKAFDLCFSVSKQIDELTRFYDWCKDAGVARSSEYPELQKLDDGRLGKMENFSKGMAAGKTKNAENENADDVEDKICMVESLPANSSSPSNLGIVEDLVSLREEDEEKKERSPALPSDVLHSNGQSEADSYTAAWELALVDSAPNLSNEKASFSGELHSIFLDPAFESTGGKMNSCVVDVNAVGVTTAVPVFSQPPSDPFAASLAVPPPSYVQVADMEKTRQPEQQVHGHPFTRWL